MNIVEDLIPKDTPNKRRPAIKRVVKCLVIHNTANLKSSAKNERRWLTNPNNKSQASYNYVVDNKEIIRVIPDDEVTWNATDGRKGKGNKNGLSIEFCESGDFEITFNKGIELVAHKLVEYKLKPTDVYPHSYFYKKKYCPRLILPRWNDFITRVETEYNKLMNATDKETSTNIDTLVSRSLINSGDYWKGNNYNPEFVKLLFIKLGRSIGCTSTDYQTNVNHLANKGVIQSVDYWLKNKVYKDEYVRLFINKFTNFIKG